MHIKSIVAGAAIALASSLGSASAAEPFSTLEGIAAEMMTSQEMGGVRGMDLNIRGTPIVAPGKPEVPLPSEGNFTGIHVTVVPGAGPAVVTRTP